MTTETPVTSPAYQAGHFARLEGCYRVLWCPESEEELAEWYRGFDAAQAEISAWWLGITVEESEAWYQRAVEAFGERDMSVTDAYRLAHRIATPRFPLPVEAP